MDKPGGERVILSPSEETVREMTERRSRFIGVVFPFHADENLKDRLKELEERFPRANHYCWAFRILHPREMDGFSDAGEPSGTAGRPIQHALAASGLAQVAAVVIRYFGGIKLGVRGLIDAYGEAAARALAATPRIALEPCGLLRLGLPYDRVDLFRHWWTRQGYDPQRVLWEYSESVHLEAPLPLDGYTAWDAFREGADPQGQFSWSLSDAALLPTPRCNP